MSKRYDSLRAGQNIYWRWRNGGTAWEYAKVHFVKDCPSLIDLQYTDPVGWIRWTTVDPNDIDYRESNSL